MRILDADSYDIGLDTGNGDLPSWGDTPGIYNGHPQVLPAINVTAPNPFNMTPHVVDTTSAMNDQGLPLVPIPAANAGTPWLLYAALAVGAWVLWKGKGRGARDW